jgi:hypothetical protein
MVTRLFISQFFIKQPLNGYGASRNGLEKNILGVILYKQLPGVPVLTTARDKGSDRGRDRDEDRGRDREEDRGSDSGSTCMWLCIHTHVALYPHAYGHGPTWSCIHVHVVMYPLAEFGYALWAIAHNFVMHHGP